MQGEGGLPGGAGFAWVGRSCGLSTQAVQSMTGEHDEHR